MNKYSKEEKELFDLMPVDRELVCIPRFISSGEQLPCLKDRCLAFKWYWNEYNSKNECYEGTNSVIPDPTKGRTPSCLLVEPIKVSSRSSSRSSLL